MPGLFREATYQITGTTATTATYTLVSSLIGTPPDSFVETYAGGIPADLTVGRVFAFFTNDEN